MGNLDTLAFVYVVCLLALSYVFDFYCVPMAYNCAAISSSVLDVFRSYLSRRSVNPDQVFFRVSCSMHAVCPLQSPVLTFCCKSDGSEGIKYFDAFNPLLHILMSDGFCIGIFSAGSSNKIRLLLYLPLFTEGFSSVWQFYVPFFCAL